jgi:hypothetical protein
MSLNHCPHQSNVLFGLGHLLPLLLHHKLRLRLLDGLIIPLHGLRDAGKEGMQGEEEEEGGRGGRRGRKQSRREEQGEFLPR